jgi:FkbM family methyltransferase
MALAVSLEDQALLRRAPHSLNSSHGFGNSWIGASVQERMRMMYRSHALSWVRSLVERFPVLAATYRNVRDEIEWGREAVTTPWGFSLAGNTRMAAGDFEPTETRLVRDLLPRVDVFVNVGANIGYYCCHALDIGVHVIAFEPLQMNVRYLCRNIRSNGWFGAEIYPLALGSEVGTAHLYGGGTGASLIRGWAGASDGHVSVIPASTMDLVLGGRLAGKRALILIDVEGAEQSVLRGAMTILSNDPKPIWIVEIMTTEHQPHGSHANANLLSTFDLFFQAGYKALTCGEALVQITREAVEAVAAERAVFPTHNFIFCEPQMNF